MKQMRFPSEAFPPCPSIELTTPDDWTGIHAPGTVVAVAAPASDAFQANVVVTWARVGPEFGLADAVREVEQRYAEEQDVAVIGSAVTVEDAEWIGEYSFVHPSAGTLVQSNLVVVLNNPSVGVTDVVHACGSCAADQIKTTFPAVREIVRSMKANAPE